MDDEKDTREFFAIKRERWGWRRERVIDLALAILLVLACLGLVAVLIWGLTLGVKPHGT